MNRPTTRTGYHSSAPCSWNMPRPHRDPSLRLMAHGKVLPMVEPGFWARVFGRIGL